MCVTLYIYQAIKKRNFRVGSAFFSFYQQNPNSTKNLLNWPTKLTSQETLTINVRDFYALTVYFFILTK